MLFVVFFLCEIAPIVILLDYSYYMQILTGGSFGQEIDATSAIPMGEALSANSTTPLLGNETTVVNHPPSYHSRGVPEERPLQTMDHLLLTSPRDGTTSIVAGSSRRNQSSKRVRFQGLSTTAGDALASESLQQTAL